MSVAAAVFAALAVAMVVAGAIGVAVMRDPYQRLHYLAPAASIAPTLFAVALFLGESDKQAALKMLVLALILNAVNGVVTHATARAHRIRQDRPFGSLAGDEQK